MHRIDAPSATVDNKFTEGSPTGGIPATTVTAHWLNDLQENVSKAIEGAGIALVKDDYTQLLAAIRGLSTGIVGLARNAKMSVTAASVTATFTADEVALGTTLGGDTY